MYPLNTDVGVRITLSNNLNIYLYLIINENNSNKILNVFSSSVRLHWCYFKGRELSCYAVVTLTLIQYVMHTTHIYMLLTETPKTRR